MRDTLRALGPGWSLVRQRKHLVFRHENGALLIAASSPSDRRALHNLRATARRLATGTVQGGQFRAPCGPGRGQG